MSTANEEKDQCIGLPLIERIKRVCHNPIRRQKEGVIPLRSKQSNTDSFFSDW
jgi:hypothetical protein